MFKAEELELLEKANAKLGISSNERRGIIFVYCPPKVGSTSLVSYIRIFASHKYKVLHIHDEVMLKVLSNISGVTVHEIIQYNALQGREVFAIDIFRPLIERKMSHYFEELSSVHFNNTEENLNAYEVGKVIARFNKVFPHIGTGDHFLEKYGIQKSEIPAFDVVKKMMYLEKEGVKYVKLRLKDSANWGEILSSLLKTEIIIRPDHETNKKPLGDLYARFKATYRLPENFVKYIEEDVGLILYYKKEEREEYKKKWCARVTVTAKSYSAEEYKLYKEISMENGLNVEIKYEHYMDNGCVCTRCTYGRTQTKTSIKKGIQKVDRIVHRPREQKKKLGLHLSF